MKSKPNCYLYCEKNLTDIRVSNRVQKNELWFGVKYMKKLFIIAIALIIALAGCSSARQKLSPQGNVNLKTANVYYQQQNVEKAESYYLKVLEDNPEHALALRRMGDINLHNGDLFKARAVEFNSKAFDYYARAIKVYESYPEITDDEKIDLRDMKKRKESSWTRLYKSGEAEMTAGNTKAAMDIFEMVNKLEPSRPEPMIQLKNIYLKDLKDDAKAEQILLTLLKDDPDKLVYLQEMGAFYYNKQNYTEAVKYFEKAKLQIPRDLDNYLNISACYYELGDYAKAMDATRTALEFEPGNVDLLDNAKNIALKLNDKDNAIKYLEELVDRRNKEDDYSVIVGLFLEKENYTQMIKYAEKWYNWDNTNDYAVRFLILAAQKTGNKTLEERFTNILKTMP